MTEIIDLEKIAVGQCLKCGGTSFTLYFPEEKSGVTLEDAVDIECTECNERYLS